MFILWIKFANASTTVSCEALKLSPILRNLILKFDRLVQEISVYLSTDSWICFKMSSNGEINPAINRQQRQKVKSNTRWQLQRIWLDFDNFVYFFEQILLLMIKNICGWQTKYISFLLYRFKYKQKRIL